MSGKKPRTPEERVARAGPPEEIARTYYGLVVFGSVSSYNAGVRILDRVTYRRRVGRRLELYERIEEATSFFSRDLTEQGANDSAGVLLSAVAAGHAGLEVIAARLDQKRRKARYKRAW